MSLFDHKRTESKIDIIINNQVKQNPALARLKSTESGFVESPGFDSRDDLVSGVNLFHFETEKKRVEIWCFSVSHRRFS